jgi:DNA-binding YbaB/EbfC family protein
VAEFDLQALLKQAQALQEKFKQMQAEAEARTVEARSGGGLVRVVADGGMQVRRIEIDPSLLASNDKEMIEDLIVAAVNQALKRAQEMVASEVGKLGPLGGLKLPGIGD